MLLRMYRLAHWFYIHHVPIIPRLIYYLQYFMFNSSLPSSCKIGKGTKLAYGGIALVIHARAEIGKDVIVGQCVTIGGRSQYYGVPKIGNNVYIGAGAKILGPVSVGDNCIIGAGAVVLNDIPDNSIAIGMPAKVVKTGINAKDFY